MTLIGLEWSHFLELRVGSLASDFWKGLGEKIAKLWNWLI